MTDRSERESLVSALGYVITHLDATGYRYTGILPRVLRELVDLKPAVVSEESCPQYGGPVRRVGRGRPKIYCSRKCRNRERYRAKVSA